jgi:hypothetical protein
VELTDNHVAFLLTMLAIITLHVAQWPNPTTLNIYTSSTTASSSNMDRPNILVYTNDLDLEGGHSNGHMTPTFSSYNFTGQSTLVPLCLGSLQWYLPIAPTWRSTVLWNGTHYVDKKLEFLGFNATEQYNATHWLHFSKCCTKQTQHYPGKGAPWEQCLFPHSTFFFFFL